MTSSSNDTDRETLARIIDPAIYMDVNRLTGDSWKASLRAADRILAEFLPGHDERVKGEAAGRVWREGYYTGKRDYAGSITGGMPISTPNPYEGES